MIQKVKKKYKFTIKQNLYLKNKALKIKNKIKIIIKILQKILINLIPTAKNNKI